MAFVKLASKTTTGGHSYWRDTDTDAILVADGSIRVSGDPTSTDDGRMEVDGKRIRDEGLIGSAENGYIAFGVPLWKGYRTFATLREAEWIAGYYGVPLILEDEGTRYRIAREK